MGMGMGTGTMGMDTAGHLRSLAQTAHLDSPVQGDQAGLEGHLARLVPGEHHMDSRRILTARPNFLVRLEGITLRTGVGGSARDADEKEERCVGKSSEQIKCTTDWQGPNTVL